MGIRHVTDPVDNAILLGERELLAQRISEPCLLGRVAVQFADVHCHTLASGVVPRTGPDAIASVDGIRPLGAEIGAPSRRAPSGSCRHGLAICISAGQSAVVGAIALTDAGDEEAHRLGWSCTTSLPSAGLSCNQDESAG